MGRVADLAWSLRHEPEPEPPMSVSIPCPVCRLGRVTCEIDPGEPVVRYYPDGSGYPGSPPGVDDFSATCECADSLLVDPGKYFDAINEAAMQTEPPTRDDYA